MTRTTVHKLDRVIFNTTFQKRRVAEKNANLYIKGELQQNATKPMPQSVTPDKIKIKANVLQNVQVPI